MKTRNNNGVTEKLICRRFIIKKGKRIYPKNGKAFCFWVPVKE